MAARLSRFSGAALTSMETRCATQMTRRLTQLETEASDVRQFLAAPSAVGRDDPCLIEEALIYQRLSSLARRSGGVGVIEVSQDTHRLSPCQPVTLGWRRATPTEGVGRGRLGLDDGRV
jgi:hypothetical protein